MIIFSGVMIALVFTWTGTFTADVPLTIMYQGAQGTLFE